MNPLTRRRLLWGLPLTATLIAGGGFATMLSRLRTGRFDPHQINIPILNRPVPDFSLESVPPYQNFNSTLLRQQKKPVLINFFASWCLPCASEMPILQKLSEQVSIWGIAYKDKTSSIQNFITNHHNPYQFIGQDTDGTIGIDWGISGVPENFLVMPGGIIKWHYASPLNSTTLPSLLNLLP